MIQNRKQITPIPHPKPYELPLLRFSVSFSRIAAKTNTHTPHSSIAPVSSLAVFFLTTETIKSAALSFKGIDNVQAGDGLALGMFGVSDGVANNALEEGLQHATGLFIDHCFVGL